MKKQLFIIFALFQISFVASQERKELEKFTLNSYYDNATKENSVGSVGCSYSKTLKDYDNGISYYADDYDNVAVVKINNKFIEFDIIAESNKNATKKGFVKGVTKSYSLKVEKTPHFKNKKFDFTEAIITIENLKTNKKLTSKLYGYCGC